MIHSICPRERGKTDLPYKVTNGLSPNSNGHLKYQTQRSKFSP